MNKGEILVEKKMKGRKKETGLFQATGFIPVFQSSRIPTRFYFNILFALR